MLQVRINIIANKRREATKTAEKVKVGEMILNQEVLPQVGAQWTTNNLDNRAKDYSED